MKVTPESEAGGLLSPPILPKTEFRIVLALLRLGAAKSAELVRHLTSRDSELLPATVTTLLQRLQSKGVVQSVRDGSGRGVLWSVPEHLIEPLLEADARDVIRSRYDSDPLMLNRLKVEVERALSEGISDVARSA